MSQRKRPRNLTQQSIEDSFSQADYNTDEAVTNIVRYIIFRAVQHPNITKSELVKNVVHRAGGRFEEIMKQVKETLLETFGFNLLMADTNRKEKLYVLSTALPSIDDPTEDKEEVPDDVQDVLLLLILTHIFMMNNNASDVSLHEFLKYFQIDPERKHPIFGNVLEYITKILPKQQYLAVTVDPITKKQQFSWGPRAEKVISKKKVLEFVCKIYKDKQPKDWPSQFQQAEEQNFENRFEDENQENI